MKDQKQKLLTKMEIDVYESNFRTRDYSELYSFCMFLVKVITFLVIIAIAYFGINSFGPTN